MDAQRHPPTLEELLARLDRLSRAVHLGEPLVAAEPLAGTPPPAEDERVTTPQDSVIANLVERVETLSRELGVVQEEVERLRARNLALGSGVERRPAASTARFTPILRAPATAETPATRPATSTVTAAAPAARPATVRRTYAASWWMRHRRAAVLAGLLSAGIAVTIAAAASSSTTPVAMASATPTQAPLAIVRPSPTPTMPPTRLATPSPTVVVSQPTASPKGTSTVAAAEPVEGLIGATRDEIDGRLGEPAIRAGARIYRGGAVRVTFERGIAVSVELDATMVPGVDLIAWLDAERPDDARLLATHWALDGTLVRTWLVPARPASASDHALAGARWTEIVNWSSRSGRATTASLTVELP